MARIRTLVLWVAGVPVVLCVVGLALGLWWISAWFESEPADASTAAAVIDGIRARFAGARPALEIRGDRLVVVREPSDSPAQPVPAAAHMLVWVPREETLSRVTLPFWLSAVSTEPIPLEALVRVAHDDVRGLLEARRRGNELQLRIADLERYGRVLLLDGVTSDGTRVLMWNE